MEFNSWFEGLNTEIKKFVITAQEMSKICGSQVAVYLNIGIGCWARRHTKIFPWSDQQYESGKIKHPVYDVTGNTNKILK